MGTRSNTLVIETGYDKEFVLANIYRQMDGYPSGHGQALADFIEGITLVNGLGLGDSDGIRYANGAGCFAAQLIADLKTGAGGIYLEKPDGDCDNDYTYILRLDTYKPTKGVSIEVLYWGKQVFKGELKGFKTFITKESR